VCRRSSHPKWEHTLTYNDVSLAELADRGLEVSVWDHDRLGHNDMIGGVRFNLGTGKKKRKKSDCSKTFFFRKAPGQALRVDGRHRQGDHHLAANAGQAQLLGGGGRAAEKRRAHG